MYIVFEQNAEHFGRGIHAPEKANSNDSGIDIYSPVEFALAPEERITLDLGVKFELKLPIGLRFLKLFGLGIEAQVRPKSGRTKSGVDVELGTIDEGYRNFCGATIINNTGKKLVIKENEKLCQIVCVPVFNRLKTKPGKVGSDTERGLGGFGSSGLTKVTPIQVDVKNTKKGKIEVPIVPKKSKKK